MSKRSPLDQLEENILDDSIPIQKILRLFIVIGGRAFSPTLRDWAKQELQGYTCTPSELPEYRVIGAPIQADSRSPFWQGKGESISVLDLPEVAHDRISQELPIYSSISKVQSLLDEGEAAKPVQILLPGYAELARLMSYQQGRRERQVIVESLYWAVHRSSLQDILDQVRNRLLEFVAELRLSMPPGASDPTVEQVHTAVQNISITVGNNSPINLTAPLSVSRQRLAVKIPVISRYRSLWKLS
jgi:hypothetical protein